MPNYIVINIHAKKCGSNMDKPKCWVKNAIKKCKVESWSWVKILHYICNPTFG